ncbi:GDP-mannose 4,6-dehydratase [Xanthobacteraceae bacterium Astr-EGSB]|uniref:GDP-mannose 4,6-dehydratase n=1 Tax=Astrobacterium formosum TaxID=3069710 RepID=UPI0027B61CDA|nr:GDP-mannose 4,6-dehydratase [Xanthobacteraceae bacterium Astr-EGSB]
MPRSLVLGANGQDGSYLVEALLRRGHEVVGVGREPSSRHSLQESRFSYLELDLCDIPHLRDLLSSLRPDFAFHVAAVHGSSGFQYETLWTEMMAVNVSSVQAILEYARISARGLRVVFAGSSKIFPNPLSGRIDENTPARGTCLYSIGKIATRDLLAYYRKEHGIATTNLILFNHESPRRSPDFLMPTLARTLLKAQLDAGATTEVRSLDFWIDWSAADELMDIAADIGERSEAEELVLASGRTWNGREAVSELFRWKGLDAARHVIPRTPAADPGPFFEVSLARLERTIGRTPKKTIFDIADDIMSSLTKNAISASDSEAVLDRLGRAADVSS